MNTAKELFNTFDKLREQKEALGDNGIYRQSQINERFYKGDQWHGLSTGQNRPLIRNNVIKRIADLKLSAVNNPVSVNYSAEGVPNTAEIKEKVVRHKKEMPTSLSPLEYNEEINLVLSGLSDYYDTTCERLQYQKLCEKLLLNAYISGTGIMYTYWDADISTGLYLDSERTTPIKGDIACEVLDVENVYFGDTALDDIQRQPYIIIAQKLYLDSVKKTAAKNRISLDIKPDNDDEHKVTVLTKFYKKTVDGKTEVFAVQAVKEGFIKNEWGLGISLYPFAKYTFLRRKNSPYGESEITYSIPNQIAINRMMTASSWGTILSGMPIMLVNNDLIRDKISNEPGQILRISGNAEDMNSAIRYITPPSFTANFENAALSLSSVTLNMAGANDAALGNLAPDNASAIIAVREAAMLPMQSHLNSYYIFSEEVARIWSQFWLNKYGDRSLKITDENGTWYLPFDASRYAHLIINARVDVTASGIISDAQSLATLDNMYDHGIIDALQYLKRLPNGIITDKNGLIKEKKEELLNAAREQITANGDNLFEDDSQDLDPLVAAAQLLGGEG
ncbi:MAG: hypothetical protein KBS41_00805 [Oscillospiraceae bacterium]|nr:hypothetical protein [Candidatus Equicaccousia limihippi]